MARNEKGIREMIGDCEHDPRFMGVFGVKNGCVACELEEQIARANSFERQLIWLADWCRKKYKVEPNQSYDEANCCTLVEIVAKVVEDNEKGKS